MVYTISTTVPYSGRTELLEVTGPEGVVFVCDHSQSEPRVVWVNAVWDGSFTETITYRMKSADGGYGSVTTGTISPQGNSCSACVVQGIWSTDSNDNLISDRPIFYTTENPWQDFWNRVTALAREYFDTPHSKLVIKNQSGNTEFPAVAETGFPRLALFNGTYVPLVEDDGRDGTTLKIRIGDKVYRIKTDTLWEAYFDVNFTDLSSYITQLMVIIDDSYNVIFYDPTNSKPLFTSTYLKRVGDERQLYAAANEYAHGPWNAEYSAAQTPYAEISNGNKVGNGSNYYTQMVVSTNLSAPNLPFTEVCFAWMYGPTQTYSQACIFNPNKQKNYPWQSYQTYGCCGEYINTLFDYNASHTFNLKNTVLFAGKVRIIKLNNNGSTSTIDLDAKIPINEILSTSHVAFAIPDKSFTNYPFESVICDNRNQSQVVFDMYDVLKTGTKISNTSLTYKAIGDYLDITSDFSDAPYSCALTAKKDCTLLAIKQDPTDYLVKITRQNLITGDTFNYSGYSVTGVYTLLAFQDETALPDEIGWSHVYNRDNWGYFYNSITKQAERDTGTYLRRNGYATEKYTNFDGDLIIQNAYGCVQKVDGQDSWSQTFFQGFAMVFLATNSTLTVNTESFDDVQAIDNTGTVVDEAVADEKGKATLTIPTTGVGRSYTVRSVYSGDETEVTASGDTTVTMTPSSDLPDFEFIWQYQYVRNTGMICGNPDTGLMFKALPSSEFRGKMLKQLCSTTYRAPFSVIGTPDGNQYHIYRENVTVTNGEGLRVCYGYQLSVGGAGVGTTGLLFDGDVRTLITVTYQSIRDYAPFTSTASLMYDSTNNITYCDVGNAVGPIVQNPPFVKVWEGTANIWSYALSAARTYFNSKPNYAVTTQLAEDVRCGDVGVLPEYSSYAQNYLVSQTFPARDAAYDRLVIARKDVKYPGCEMAFVWYTGGPTEACIVKQNNEHVLHSATMTGDFMTIANGSTVTINQFDGVLKYKVGNDDMVTRDMSSSSLTINMANIMGISCFFCYPNVPNKYVIYQGIAAGNVTDNRYTFKGAPKSAVTIAYTTDSTNWNYGVAYDGSISATVTYDMDYKNTNNVWVNTRTNVNANHQSSNTYKIIGKTGAFTSTYSQNDAQFTGTSFEDVAQKVRQYFDSL